MRRRLLLALIVVAIATGGYVTARVKRDFWDFEVFRTAGSRVLAAERLYRPDDGHYQFKYWPAFALAMTPFAAIPPEAGKVIWYGLTVGLIAVFLTLCIRALPDRRSSTQFLMWWTVLLTAKFLVKELVNGQTNVLLGVLVVLSLAAVEQGRPVRAGVLIGLATFAKPYALLFLPWLAAAEGAAALSAAVATLAVGGMAPAAVYGWQGNLQLHAEWYRTVAETTSPNLLFPENVSFAAMWAKWIGPSSVAGTLAGVMVAASLAVAIVLWARRGTVSRPGFLEVGYLLLLVPLISPQGWDYVLLLATPAIVCLVDRFRESSKGWRATAATGFLLTSFTIYDLLGRTVYLHLMSLSVVTVGALLLAACLVRLRLAVHPVS